jgi:tRNA(Ile2) C34 agmatinyltransferase TiaS
MVGRYDTRMIVRCGRCRVELEVAGAGEFLCPNCGTRNAVRGDPAPAVPPVLDLGSQPPSTGEPAADVRWVRCPSCSFRFAVGAVEQVGCPTCGTTIDTTEEGVGLSGTG